MSAWLPDLILFTDYNGDWPSYERALYDVFVTCFITSESTAFSPKRLAVKKQPYPKNRELGFWHLISEEQNRRRGAPPNEEERTPDMRRCERIRWPRPVIDKYQSDCVVYWRTEERRQLFTLIALPDFSYALILREGENYMQLVTHYVTWERRGQEFRAQYEEYVASGKPVPRDRY